MVPTWVAVVAALSLAILALAAIVVAAAALSAALGVRGVLGMLRGLAGPALEDVRTLVGTIRAEVEGLTATSRDLRGRVVKAADAAQARLAALDALVDGVQQDVRAAALDIVATLRTVRRGASLVDLGRRVFADRGDREGEGEQEGEGEGEAEGEAEGQTEGPGGEETRGKRSGAAVRGRKRGPKRGRGRGER